MTFALAGFTRSNGACAIEEKGPCIRADAQRARSDCSIGSSASETSVPCPPRHTGRHCERGPRGVGRRPPRRDGAPAPPPRAALAPRRRDPRWGGPPVPHRRRAVCRDAVVGVSAALPRRPPRGEPAPVVREAPAVSVLVRAGKVLVRLGGPASMRRTHFLTARPLVGAHTIHLPAYLPWRPLRCLDGIFLSSGRCRGVGPFRYYEAKQVPNFLLAAPTLVRAAAPLTTPPRPRQQHTRPTAGSLRVVPRG